LVFLPPYSPDFNPIENAFAKLKALLRAAAERTVEALWITIGSLIDRFTPEECANYFAASMAWRMPAPLWLERLSMTCRSQNPAI
jgi:transposase